MKAIIYNTEHYKWRIHKKRLTKTLRVQKDTFDTVIYRDNDSKKGKKGKS